MAAPNKEPKVAQSMVPPPIKMLHTRRLQELRGRND